jgi:hypothetical protein
MVAFGKVTDAERAEDDGMLTSLATRNGVLTFKNSCGRWLYLEMARLGG